MKNSFFLIIPPQQINPERLKSFQEAALKQWVAELPIANPSLSTRLFHDFILEFNQLEIDTKLRLEALETLRPSYIILEDYLRSRLMQTSFPKTESDQRIMDILVAIEKEFSIAYWIVAREMTRKEASWLQSKNIALSIQRCIKGLSALVITYSIMYQPIPDWIWIDLHSLYKLGETLNKETTKVSAEFNHLSKTTSIEESYQQILLLSLAQPNGLMQKEIPQVYQFLEPLSSLIKLENKLVTHYKTQCVVRLDDDKPPFFQHQSSKFEDSGLRYINFDKLHKIFNKNKDKFIDSESARFSSIRGQTSNPFKLPVELLDYLEQKWLALDLQRIVAFTDRLDRYIAFGLDAAHDLQSSLITQTEEDLEHLAQSASERSLTCEFNKPGILSIGSLISFRKKDMPKHKRSLGVISKIALLKQINKINFEIEILAVQFYAVGFEYIDEKNPLRKKALLYGVKETGKEEKSFIIIESFMIKNGDIIRLYMAQEDFPIILRDRQNIGLGYWQFECRRLAESDINSNKKRGYDFI